jgi:hypothetical protein
MEHVLERQLVTQLLRKFIAIYRTQRCVSDFKAVFNRILSEPNESISHPVSLRSILVHVKPHSALLRLRLSLMESSVPVILSQ